MTFEEAIEGLPIIIMGSCCTIGDVIAKEERGDVVCFLVESKYHGALSLTGELNVSKKLYDENKTDYEKTDFKIIRKSVMIDGKLIPEYHVVLNDIGERTIWGI